MPKGESRNVLDLLPFAAERCLAWLKAVEAKGHPWLVYSTWRGPEVQADLYALGRTVPGTNRFGRKGYGPGYYATLAGPWESYHQVRVAWDAVPMVYGKPDWTYADVNLDRRPDEPWWLAGVEAAEALGIEWAGNWTTFREFVHFQFPNGLDRASLKNLALDFEAARKL